MVVNRRKKGTKSHGTHGWGRNKHRKSGSRGGCGNAGTGKKSHCNKPKIWGQDYLGKYGFVSVHRNKVNAISLRDIEDKIPAWLNEKKIKQEAENIVINLKELGYTKLLSTGKVSRKIKITIPKASAGVEEKIKAAGGELVNK